MSQKSDLPNSMPGMSKQTAMLAAGLVISFVVILLLLHFLESEIDPSSQMISEYETGHFGWMMRLAFFFWGGSVLALVSTLRSSVRTIPGKIGQWWLVLIGVALFGAGIFITNAITDTTPNTANTLHALCGAFVIFTFPIAASLVAGSLARNQEWTTARRRLLWATLLVWFGLIAFFGSEIISNAINPLAGLGWPNRFMVFVYIIWLIFVALRVARIARQNELEAS